MGATSEEATSLWAVVSSSGVVRGSGVESSSLKATGHYTVVFDQDVSECAYYATAGITQAVEQSGGSTVSAGETGLAPGAGNPNAVAVTRGTGNGAPISLPVYVAVFC